MSLGGAALMAVGHGYAGDDRASEAAEQALSSHLLDVTIDGARGILFNVTGGPNLSLYEINQAASIIRETAHPDVNLIFGAVIDEKMEDKIRITVIATGFEHHMPLVRPITRAVSRSAQKDMPNQPPVRESVSVGATAKPASPSQSRMSQQAYRINDLDVPAFLRKRR